MTRQRLRSSHRLGAPLACALLVLALDARAADVVIQVTDPANQGFNDPGPPDAESTAGGNDGATLGEQRLRAMEEATAIWAARLDSDVPIVVEAGMEVLECSPSGAVLGSAAPMYFMHDPAAQRWYPAALANARAGYDLAPDSGDILALFSTNVDTDNCLGSTRWYYGFDGNPAPGDVDFLSVALHELAHGLGVVSMTDLETGAFLGNNGNPSGYSALIYDLTQGARWPDLTTAQRAASVQTPRTLAWDGPAVAAAAPEQLAEGSPLVVATPNVPGFSGAISETNFGPTLLQQSAEGELVEVSNSCNVPSDVQGKVVLIQFAGCLGIDAAAAQGAVGALFNAGSDSRPPGDLNLDIAADVTIPTLHVSATDAAALAQALNGQSISIALSASPARVGTEGGGRVYINATDPISPGSSIAHFDSLTRRTETLDARNRDLLMEPAGEVAGSQVDLTEALLHDIGWTPVQCGDGDVGGSEACDDGAANSNTTPDACRTNCQPASCGDGITDSGEDCDLAADNGVPGSGCNPDCEVVACGNGEVDPDEACDEAGDNSDTEPDRCRTDCTLPRCGDGVTDSSEQCDSGASNGTMPGGCLSDCTLVVCGDGVLDSGEACDTGSQNSDTAADACRTDCSLPTCGDGVVDSGETCDDGAQNDDDAPDACRSSCRLAYCGDAVLDAGEACDEGPRNADTPNACRSDCELPVCGDGIVDDGEQCDDGNTNVGDACSPACTATHAGDPTMPSSSTGVSPEPSSGPVTTGTAPSTDVPGSIPDATSTPDSTPHPGAETATPDAGTSTVSNTTGSEDGCACRSVGARGTGAATYGAWFALLGLGLLRRASTT